MRLVVVGAGISGLAAAYEARRIAEGTGVPLEITILESDARAGGKIWTERADGVGLEWGPDSFVAAKPAARELAAELGLEVVKPLPTSRRAYLLIGGELRPFPVGTVMGVPRGIRALATAARAGVVSPAAAVRAALEPLAPGRVRDEPVARAARRRLGRAWARRLVEPLVAGVYGASAEDLGMGATLPQFANACSLVLAARRQPSPTVAAFLSIRGGMESLIQRLVERLADCDLRLRTPVAGVERAGSGLVVRAGDAELPADGVIVTASAPTASRLLGPVAPDAAAHLARIRFGSSVVVMMRFEPVAISRPLDGSGYLVGPDEGLAHAACSWLTTKWPHDGEAVWLRAIVTDPAALHENQTVVARRVADEVGQVVGASAPPIDLRSHAWEEALPIYTTGHLDRVEAIERALPPGIALAGASYRGVGVPDCIDSGRSAARRLLTRR